MYELPQTKYTSIIVRNFNPGYLIQLSRVGSVVTEESINVVSTYICKRVICLSFGSTHKRNTLKVLYFKSTKINLQYFKLKLFT